MDEPITQEQLVIDQELTSLLDSAQKTYDEHFNGDVWLGRCIFLSFYCSVNSCTFCFRSVADKHSQDPKKALRSLGSIIAEALFIRAFGWRIEFLTGGQGIADQERIARYVRLVRAILDEPVWVNLGALSPAELTSIADDIGGVVASIETLDPTLHSQVCPDKPLRPYEQFLDAAGALGLKRSITLVIGLGETREHWHLAQEFIKRYQLDRITIYALRPVKGTTHTKGPTPQDVAWWVAKVRTSFPTIEIIAGTAEYRVQEIPLLLRAGANAITKLPATKMMNSPQGREVESLITSTGRNWTSMLTHPDPNTALDYSAIINSLELSSQEKEEVHATLARYLVMMSRNTE